MGRILYLSEFSKEIAPIEQLNREESVKRLSTEIQRLKLELAEVKIEVEELKKILVVKS